MRYKRLICPELLINPQVLIFRLTLLLIPFPFVFASAPILPPLALSSPSSSALVSARYSDMFNMSDMAAPLLLIFDFSRSDTIPYVVDLLAQSSTLLFPELPGLLTYVSAANPEVSMLNLPLMPICSSHSHVAWQHYFSPPRSRCA